MLFWGAFWGEVLKNGQLWNPQNTNRQFQIVADLFKAAMKRGFTASLHPYGLHSDTPAQDKDFLFKGDLDPNEKGSLNLSHCGHS